jgi:hypothetical protein
MWNFRKMGFTIVLNCNDCTFSFHKFGAVLQHLLDLNLKPMNTPNVSANVPAGFALFSLKPQCD